VNLAAHCLVEGKTNERIGFDGKSSYAIVFRLRLPDDWNGRMIFEGGGGNDGTLSAAVGPNIAIDGTMAPCATGRLGRGHHRWRPYRNQWCRFRHRPAGPHRPSIQRL